MRLLLMIAFGLVFCNMINMQIINAEDNEIKAGVTAPDFTGKKLDGNELKLSEYKGKVVLLDFWASWCGPCQKELPFLMELFDNNDDKNFIIIAVNIDKKIESAQKFLDKIKGKAHFPVIWDNTSAIPSLYQIETMPTTIFIDKEGIIRYIHKGFSDSSKEELMKELEELLK